MSEQRSGGGPNWGLLLLIPVAVIVAKGAMRRRAEWEAAGGRPWDAAGGRPWARAGSHAWGAAGRGRGCHGRLEGDATEAKEPGAFPLPPRIERILDTWHARAHRSGEPIDSATA